MKLLLSALILLTSAQASEIDSFTKRYSIKSDSAEVLNKLTNERIEKALVRANKKNPCSKKRLKKSLLKQLKGNVVGGPIEFYINGSTEAELDRIHLRRRESVYRGLNFFQAPVLKLPLGSFGRIVKVGDHIVGADKFGHFFTEGLVYFNKAKKDGIQDALDWGHRTEKGKFGNLTTAVYSRADQVANYGGYLFWKSLFEKSEGYGPYFACNDKKWELVKTFDWRDFVDAGWDEGINCSSYRSEKVRRTVEGNIAALEDDSESASSCPIIQEIHKCEQLVEKYEAVFPKMITDKCKANQ